MLIYMADTGLLAPGAGHPWLSGVRKATQPTGIRGRPDPIPPYTAHGTFVAGVARCMAPSADIIVTNAFSIAGSQLEADLVPSSKRRSAWAWTSSISPWPASRGTTFRLSLPGRLRRLRQYGGIVCSPPPVTAASGGPPGRPHSPRCCPSGARRRLARPGLVQQLRRVGGRVRARARPHQRVHDRTYACHISPYAESTRSGTSTAWPSGVAHPSRRHRDRADRLPDVAYGRKRAGGRRAARRGTAPGDPGGRGSPAAPLPRRTSTACRDEPRCGHEPGPLATGHRLLLPGTQVVRSGGCRGPESSAAQGDAVISGETVRLDGPQPPPGAPGLCRKSRESAEEI